MSATERAVANRPGQEGGRAAAHGAAPGFRARLQLQRASFNFRISLCRASASPQEAPASEVGQQHTHRAVGKGTNVLWQARVCTLVAWPSGRGQRLLPCCEEKAPPPAAQPAAPRSSHACSSRPARMEGTLAGLV